jgi:hypothetical protein
MIVTRILWIFPGAYLPRWIDGRFRRVKPLYPPWRHIFFAGWAGVSSFSSSSRLHLAMIAARREAVIALRDRSEIGDDVMRRLLSEFDHEEILLHQRGNRVTIKAGTGLE